MAKIKHISDGTNTWDVGGGGTEVFTDPDNVVYDRLKVVAPLKVTNDGADDCLGADFKLPNQIVLYNEFEKGYTELSMLDENGDQVGITTKFNTLTPVIYGEWSNYDSVNECFKGISLNMYTEDDLTDDCILVINSSRKGCQYAEIDFNNQLFGNSFVLFCNQDISTSDKIYFTTTRNTYFRVIHVDGNIMLNPIENPSYKYRTILNCYDIDVNVADAYEEIKDSTATVNQIVGAILAVYSWGNITIDIERRYFLVDNNGNNIDPHTFISFKKDREYIECQHFTEPVNNIYKLRPTYGGRPIIPIKAVSCSPYMSDSYLCQNTCPVFYDNQGTEINKGFKLAEDALWPSNQSSENYCYNFFIFGEIQSS